MPDARIQYAIQYIHQQIDADNQGCNQQNAALYHWIIAPANCIDHPFTDSRPLKSCFGQYRAGQQGASLQAHHGHDRNQCITQCMHHNHAQRRQPLGARGADEIFAQHFKHRGAVQAPIPGKRKVPSTIEGRIKCFTADVKAPVSGDRSVSINSNPVVDGTSYSVAIRPDTGVMPSFTENSMISSKPHQKMGIEYPVNAVVITLRSSREPRLSAAATPAGTPVASANISAHSESSTVAGKRAKNSDSTLT